MPCLVMLRYASVCIVFTVSPSFLSLDIETDAAATQYDYGVDDPSFLPEQPGKPPPLITKYRLFLSILLALE